LVVLDNKGLMFRNIIAGIIILVIAGILLLIITNILKGGGESADRESCRTSVLLKAQSKIMGTPLYDTINCKTEVHDIDQGNEEEIYKFITYRMYDCWYQFGEGKKDFLSDIDWGYGDNWCWICSRIDFDDNIQKNLPELTGLTDYLMTEKIPLAEGEQTFFEYLYGEVYDENKETFKIDEGYEDSYLTKDPLYVAFFADKRTTSEDSWDAGTYGAAGGAMLALGACYIGSTIAGIFSFGTLGVAGYAVCTSVGAGVGTALWATSVKSGAPQALYLGSDQSVIESCNQ